jgi:hypothetical protein
MKRALLRMLATAALFAVVISVLIAAGLHHKLLDGSHRPHSPAPAPL